ncbi:tetratricopeptide repeat protein [Dysgonomonas sp. 511]|uniref:tetratricopeptide repeat protein n=1 Tax=Dysgonomonas sp. 511 TaxID=2302930 RepID=UPI0013D6FFBC|nr:tetratricopeptide repeat protein [Dysgonomonas sp. 511]
MKGELQYNKAQYIINKLYSRDYTIENKHCNKVDMYNLYLTYLRKSAYQGFPLAQYDLGQTYENINFWGKNPNYSPRKCVYWYKRAASNNIAAAFNNLAGFYESGEGVKQDLNFALELYKKAESLGDKDGRKNYQLLLRQLRKGSYLAKKDNL